MRINMENEHVEFFKKLSEYRKECDQHSPDSFSIVAQELYGMSVKEAQMLLTKYKRILSGWWDWEENEEEGIDVATKGKAVLEHSFKLEPSKKWDGIKSYLDIDEYGYGYRNHIAVWVKYTDKKQPQMLELKIDSAKNLAMIHDLSEREDVEVLCIVPGVDSISNLQDCENDVDTRNGRMRVYDGDIFVLSNHGVDNYWNRPSENGVYVCMDGAYRRLLYTLGRGYIDINKKPNVANDSNRDDEYGDVFTFYEGKWNQHLLTMDHKWKRIGNIHADISLLMEKNFI